MERVQQKICALGLLFTYSVAGAQNISAISLGVDSATLYSDSGRSVHLGLELKLAEGFVLDGSLALLQMESVNDVGVRLGGKWFFGGDTRRDLFLQGQINYHTLDDLRFPDQQVVGVLSSLGYRFLVSDPLSYDIKIGIDYFQNLSSPFLKDFPSINVKLGAAVNLHF